VLTRRNVADSHCHRTLNRRFQKTVSGGHGRPAQERLTAWRACSVEVSMSRVRAPEEGQRLPDALASSICFPLAFIARSAEPQPSAIAG